VQEALTNIRKYAQACEVEVTLELRGPELIVEVRDNGLGFDLAAVAQRGTLGLLGMRERVIALGGRIEVHSTPGQGTTISVVIPLEPKVAKGPA
jgi:signal transduction histidine kinase